MKGPTIRDCVIAAMLGPLSLTGMTAPAGAETVQVKIEKLAFAPQRVTLHRGDTIQWTNADFIAHTATARNGAWDIMIPPNATKSVVVNAAGTLQYYCKFHPNMTGIIDVAP